MFKALKDNKIIAISEKKEVVVRTEDGDEITEITGEELFPYLVFDEVIEDTEHTVDEYEHYQGEFLLKSDIPAPTREEISVMREQAYIKEVDVLHAQKNRKTILGTWTEENEANYIAEVKRLSEDIANRYPYPEETVTEIVEEQLELPLEV